MLLLACVCIMWVFMMNCDSDLEEGTFVVYVVFYKSWVRSMGLGSVCELSWLSFINEEDKLEVREYMCLFDVEDVDPRELAVKGVHVWLVDTLEHMKIGTLVECVSVINDFDGKRER